MRPFGRLERIFLFFLLMLAISTSAAFVGLYNGHRQAEESRNQLQEMRLEIQKTQEYIREQSEFLRNVDELMRQQEKLLDTLQIDEIEVTAYAPLDPAAKAGMCYSGDPRVTATGARTTPGRTIAVDPRVIKLNSRVYISGIGWRVAEDTGGLIKGNKIDLCVWTKEEALNYGRQKAVVIYER